MSKLWEIASSKKLLAGPASATTLLAAGQIDGWQWAAVTLGYVAIQGAVDVVKAKIGLPEKAIDQQNGESQPHP